MKNVSLTVFQLILNIKDLFQKAEKLFILLLPLNN